MLLILAKEVVGNAKHDSGPVCKTRCGSTAQKKRIKKASKKLLAFCVKMAYYNKHTRNSPKQSTEHLSGMILHLQRVHKTCQICHRLLVIYKTPFLNWHVYRFASMNSSLQKWLCIFTSHKAVITDSRLALHKVI